MRMFTPNGGAIRVLRKRRSHRKTQEAFAREIGVSERTLRDIENLNKPIDELQADRIASALKVGRGDVVFATEGPRLVATPPTQSPMPASVHTTRGKQLVPRFDKDTACDVGSGESLYDLACRCDFVIAESRIPMNGEISSYVSELVSLIEAASWMKRERFSKLEAEVEKSQRNCMRHLLVQLRGNDVWTYALHHTKHLPVSDEVPEISSTDVEWHAIVVFDSPGEYGENTVEVDVDNGHPWIIDWDKPMHCPTRRA
ncbi:helix-turn-helix transcriptional regulator [Rhizomicrobium palustre]